MTGRSSDTEHPTHGTRLRAVRPDGTPIYRYQQRPGMPPIGVVGFGEHDQQPPPGHRHAHDFLVLMFVEAGDTTASSTSAIDTRLIGRLKAKLSYNVQYEQDAVAGQKSLDTVGRATLVYAF